MATAVRLDPDPRIAALLLRHPGVAGATVRVAGDGVLEARVLPAPPRRRVPAEGRCVLIEASGSVLEGELVDISWAGVCVRLAEGAGAAPPLGAEVQLWIEAEALGRGVDGWLGRVRWVRDREVGVAFEGNADEGAPLLQLVEAFERAAPGLQEAARVRPGGRSLRVAFERRARLLVGSTEVHARTLDISAAGVGLELCETLHLDLRTRDVQVGIDADRLWDEPFRATVVHHDGRRVGIELRSDAGAVRLLAAVTEREAGRDAVSPAALCDWLRGFGVHDPVRVRHVG